MKLDFSKPLYVLAPLAGYTDLPFRSVVKKFGADLTISEMISSNALVYDSKKTYKMLEKSPDEDPYFVQIAGGDPAVVKEAVERLNELEGIDGIDLNCGCPVPKVVKQGAGSALLEDLDRLGKIVQTIKETSNKHYTSVKIRLGFTENRVVEIVKVIEEAGADFVTIHGRTRSGGFKAKVDYKAIAQAKESVSIPVIANGDITDYKKTQEVLLITKADGVMIGRGAIGKPWIFYQLKHGKEDVDASLKKEIILEHFHQMIRFYGEYGAVLFRKHLHTYSKGYPGATHFRTKINEVENPEEMEQMIKDFF
ncbi:MULTISPECIES: tRNA dihydrouridine synthase DusB [unclassified Nitratiruptor]|uniref:tRNA dihydrouridine synthase DusB n=1 Tax=unclassified Nitratiruptor TaxID=2624044 RepID=UPI001916B750|nr:MULTISPECIES: tRNA dihydrouridine synthase DusB [unclassified Nitratiruptor]BCD60084.1 tRNA-dihydrouridine synthase B [Nitratiruptor sp. YY08-10]BCD64427.1 tRNA-dihydrouridine synthase B [Nitratiruptor sp. YY08-14]